MAMLISVSISLPPKLRQPQPQPCLRRPTDSIRQTSIGHFKPIGPSIFSRNRRWIVLFASARAPRPIVSLSILQSFLLSLFLQPPQCCSLSKESFCNLVYGLVDFVLISYLKGKFVFTVVFRCGFQDQATYDRWEEIEGHNLGYCFAFQHGALKCNL